MPNEFSWTRFRGAALLAAGAIVVSACGGSAEFREGGAGAAGSAVGGAPSAGAGGVGVSGGGAGGGGGWRDSGEAGSACVNVECPSDGACGPGYKAVTDASGCCTTCVPDGSGGSGGNSCAYTSCPAIACGPGTKWASVPGQCCGTCVPDPEACSEAQAAYQDLRSQLLSAPGALNCGTTADCQFLSSSARCGAPCPSSAVSTAAAKSIEQQLNQFEAVNCSFCPAVEVPCVAPPPPFCAGGTCILGGYL
jgi:hypothetical protein